MYSKQHVIICDASDDRHSWTHSPAAVAWCRAHGFETVDTYRLEIDVDAQCATVYQYERDANGHLFQRDGDVARREPFTVSVHELPPIEPIEVA